MVTHVTKKNSKPFDAINKPIDILLRGLNYKTLNKEDKKVVLMTKI